jgi:hypothetical protein
MMRALLASHDQELYELTISRIEDIEDQVREQHVEALTSTCGQFDFWTTPSLRGGNQIINGPATKMLLGVTRFTAADVPILRGAIVVASHDHAGELAGLTTPEIERLVDASYELPRRSDTWVLDRRINRLERAGRNQSRPRRAAQRRRIAEDMGGRWPFA